MCELQFGREDVFERLDPVEFFARLTTLFH
jgi:hypothetical protein